MAVKIIMMLAFVGSSMARRTDLKKVVNIVQDNTQSPRGSARSSRDDGSIQMMSSARESALQEQLGQLLESGVSVKQSSVGGLKMSIVRVEEGSMGNQINAGLQERNEAGFKSQTALKMEEAFESMSTALTEVAESKIQEFAGDIAQEMEALNSKNNNCNGDSCSFVLCSFTGTSTGKRKPVPVKGEKYSQGVIFTGPQCADDPKGRGWPNVVSGKCFAEERGRQLRGVLQDLATDNLVVDDKTTNYFDSQRLLTLVLKAFEGEVPANACSEGDVKAIEKSAKDVQSQVESVAGSVSSSRESAVDEYDALVALLDPEQGSITGFPGLNPSKQSGKSSANGAEFSPVY